MMKKPDQWNITDLSEEEQEEYDRITDYLSQETGLDSASWGRIGQILVNSYLEDKLRKEK